MSTDDYQIEEPSNEALDPSMMEQAGLIGELLKEAAKNNLQAEVVTWALMAMREDPTLEPYEAFGYGYGEWIK